MNTDIFKRVEDYIYSQLHDDLALQELKNIGPQDYDWYPRVKEAVDRLLPRLVEIAPRLVAEGVKLFNSPHLLKNKLNSDIPEQVLKAMQLADSSLAYKFDEWLSESREISEIAARNIDVLESQQISAEIQRYLVSDNCLGDLVAVNGHSIYPDLILNYFDYSFLPLQNRHMPVDGPCLKGKKEPKPSNVPDGCEIKTNRGGSIRVDAHGAHPGLHVAITWQLNEEERKIDILDCWAAYIRIYDHTHSDGKVDVTTKKRSFGHKCFVSLTTGYKKGAIISP